MDSRANAKEFVVRLHEVAEAAETGSPMPSEGVVTLTTV